MIINKEELKNSTQEKIFNFAMDTPYVVKNFPEQKKLIILIDIVGFSKSSTRQQVNIIYQFQKFLLGHILTSKIEFKGKIRISQFIPTGDGCYIVADPCDSEIAISFLISLIIGFQKFNFIDETFSYSLRCSASYGMCVPFLDLSHHKNYIGEGMNEVSRILSGGQKVLEDYFENNLKCEDKIGKKIFSRNSLYVDNTLAEALTKFSNFGNKIYYFQQVLDKHGKKRDITILQGIKENL